MINVISALLYNRNETKIFRCYSQLTFAHQAITGKRRKLNKNDRLFPTVKLGIHTTRVHMPRLRAVYVPRTRVS